MFCIPRAAGWLAHWLEAMQEPTIRIFRPLQMYIGNKEKKFIPLAERKQEEDNKKKLVGYYSDFSTRRAISLMYFQQQEFTPDSSNPKYLK